MNLLPGYRKSFFMGQQRPDGLQLKMRYRKGLVYTDMTVSDAFQGYEGVVHGGMLFGILDVLMWYAIFIEARKVCMTRKTDMDFLKPVLCGQPYRAHGRLLRIEDRDVWATGWIEGPDRDSTLRSPPSSGKQRLLTTKTWWPGWTLPTSRLR